MCTLLKKYQTSAGPHLSKLDIKNLSEIYGIQIVQQERENFQSTHLSVLLKLQESMTKRFDDSKTGVKNGTQLVIFSTWEAKPEEDFDDYWVKLLANHFEQPLKNADVDCDLLQIEWDLLKNQVYGRFQTQLTTMKLQWDQANNAI